jgi:hypothetical protein
MTNTTDLNTETIDHLLKFDPLDQAEKITGYSYKDDRETSTLGLGLALLHNERKRNALAASGDSHFHTTYIEYLELLQDLGFEIVLQDYFEGDRYDNSPTIYEGFTVLWHPEDGILATAESYGTGLNSSKVYYNVMVDQTNHAFYRVISSGHFNTPSYDAGIKIWVGDHDGREGIKHNLNRLREVGEFQARWIERPFLWLLTYMDARPGHGNYDHEKINEARISRLPEHVRNAITPEA